MTVKSHLNDLYCVSELSLLNCNVFEKITKENTSSIFIEGTSVASSLWSRTRYYQLGYTGSLFLKEQPAVKDGEIMCEDHHFGQNKL